MQPLSQRIRANKRELGNPTTVGYAHRQFFNAGLEEAAAALVTPAEDAALDLLAALKDECGIYRNREPVCQKGLMERCQCSNCRLERSRQAIAKAAGQPPAGGS